MPSAAWPACASAAAWVWRWRSSADKPIKTRYEDRRRHMANRVALVTGGMGGLGEAICIKLAALGYTVVTTYSPGSNKAEGWLAAMREQGLNFKAYECNVADYDSAQACVAKVVQEVGPIDVLVNNAGITRDMTFKKMDKTAWD